MIDYVEVYGKFTAKNFEVMVSRRKRNWKMLQERMRIAVRKLVDNSLVNVS